MEKVSNDYNKVHEWGTHTAWIDTDFQQISQRCTDNTLIVFSCQFAIELKHSGTIFKNLYWIFAVTINDICGYMIAWL